MCANTNSSGCVHTDSLYLTINNSSITNIIDTACGEYLWQGSIYDNSGSYTNILTDNNGCDSILNLQLTIFETSSIEYILGYGGTGQILGDVFGMGLYGNQGIFVTFSGDQYDIISNYSLPLNSWQNLTAVHKLDGLVEIYLNANLIYSQQVDIPNINLINGYIGVAPWGTNSFWNGGIDDVMIWNRALNQQEINNYMNCPPNDSDSGLLSI